MYTLKKVTFFIFIWGLCLLRYSHSQDHYDWIETDSLKEKRINHSIIQLTSGEILTIGGTGDSTLNSCELYNPSLGKWKSIPSMFEKRSSPKSVKLDSDEIIVMGGINYDKTLQSCEIYNPVSNTWRLTDSLITNRKPYGYSVTKLLDGKILVTGGLFFDQVNNENIFLKSSELYDPINSKWIKIADMNNGRVFHSATLLQDGRVLVAGGLNDGATSSCEIYDPENNTWKIITSLNESRVSHSAILLKNGNVLISGGFDSNSPEYVKKSTELYNVVNDIWVMGGNMIDARSDHKMFQLQDTDKIIIIGSSQSRTSTYDSFEIFNTVNLRTEKISLIPRTGSIGQNSIRLNNTQFMIIGGEEIDYSSGIPYIDKTNKCLISSSITSINFEDEIPTSIKLSQNYPNPFNPSTNIKFSIQKLEKIKIIIYNSIGQEIKTICNSIFDKGEHSIQFNSEGLSSGVYYYSLFVGEKIITKKMVIMK